MTVGAFRVPIGGSLSSRLYENPGSLERQPCDDRYPRLVAWTMGNVPAPALLGIRSLGPCHRTGPFGGLNNSWMSSPAQVSSSPASRVSLPRTDQASWNWGS